MKLVASEAEFARLSAVASDVAALRADVAGMPALPKQVCWRSCRRGRG